MKYQLDQCEKLANYRGKRSTTLKYYLLKNDSYNPTCNEIEADQVSNCLVEFIKNINYYNFWSQESLFSSALVVTLCARQMNNKNFKYVSNNKELGSNLYDGSNNTYYILFETLCDFIENLGECAKVVKEYSDKTEKRIVWEGGGAKYVDRTIDSLINISNLYKLLSGTELPDIEQLRKVKLNMEEFLKYKKSGGTLPNYENPFVDYGINVTGSRTQTKEFFDKLLKETAKMISDFYSHYKNENNWFASNQIMFAFVKIIAHGFPIINKPNSEYSTYLTELKSLQNGNKNWEALVTDSSNQYLKLCLAFKKQTTGCYDNPSNSNSICKIDL